MNFKKKILLESPSSQKHYWRCSIGSRSLIAFYIDWKVNGVCRRMLLSRQMDNWKVPFSVQAGEIIRSDIWQFPPWNRPILIIGWMNCFSIQVMRTELSGQNYPTVFLDVQSYWCGQLICWEKYWERVFLIIPVENIHSVHHWISNLLSLLHQSNNYPT